MRITNGLKPLLTAIRKTFRKLWMIPEKQSSDETLVSLEDETLTFKMESTTEKYQPETIDTFNFGVRDGVCLIQAYSTLPSSLYQGLLRIGASIYSPKRVTILVEERNSQSQIAIYQDGNRFDFSWMLSALNRTDPGWTMQEGILLSVAARSDLADLQDLLQLADRQNANLDEEKQLELLKV